MPSAYTSAPRVVSYSEISSGRACPHQHELAYKDRWVPPREGPALVRGTAWHAIMEYHYQAQKVGAKRGDIRASLAPLFFYDEDGTQSDEQSLLEWMYDGYVQQWAAEDGEFKIVAVEHEAEVPLPTSKGTMSQFRLKMKIDLVVRDRRGKLWVVDHKTCQNLPSNRELELDDQFGLYTWGMRQLGHQVFGCIYNAARTTRNKIKKQPLDERFSRTLMARNDDELDTLAIEAWRSARAVYAWQPGTAPRHPDSEKCRFRCSFTEPCLASRRGMDEVRFLHDTGYVQDPTRH